MFRAAARTAPRALRQPTVASAAGRRFASTAPADKRYTWKGTAARWSAALGALYWYNTSSIFADDLPSHLSTEPPHFSEADLTTVDAIVEEKRKTLDARLKAKEQEAAKAKAAQPPPPQNNDSTAAVATADDAEKSPEQLEQEAGQQGAFNPETGEINWDCPCLGGMAHGPCGEEFKAAFSCFVYSTEEVKGMDCVDKFQHMQDCFRKYPEVYGEEIADEEAAEREAEAAAAGSPAAGGDEDVQNAALKHTEAAAPSPAPASTTSEKPAASAKSDKSSTATPEQKAHDATAANTKAVAAEAPKAAISDSNNKDKVVEKERSIPKSAFDATPANNEGSK